jgi:hypothetical protein
LSDAPPSTRATHKKARSLPARGGFWLNRNRVKRNIKKILFSKIILRQAKNRSFDLAPL